MKYVSPRFFLDKWPTLRKHLRNFIISGKFVGGDASFWDAYYINRRNCSEGKAKKAYVTPLVEAEGVLEMKLNPVWFNVEDMVQVALVNCDEIDTSPSASCCSLIKKNGKRRQLHNPCFRPAVPFLPNAFEVFGRDFEGSNYRCAPQKNDALEFEA